MGQLDGDLGAGVGQRVQAVAPAQRRHQFHVVGGLHRSYGLGTDTALGADDCHAQFAHRARFLRLLG